MITIGFTQDVFTNFEDDGMGGNSIVMACVRVLVGELDRAVVITVSASDGSAVGTSKCMFFMKHISHVISCFLNFFSWRRLC